MKNNSTSKKDKLMIDKRSPRFKVKQDEIRSFPIEESKLNKIIPVADKARDIYIDWIKKHGGSFCKLELIKDKNEDGRSVFATEDIDDNEKIATLPFKLAITEIVARKLFPGLNDFSCRMIMSLYITHQKAIGSSFYAPYLNILPKIIKTPFFFNEDELKYLENTNLATSVRERLQNIKSDYDNLLNHLQDDIKKLVTWESFLWAYSVLSSRSFPYKLINPNYDDDKHGASEVLFPLLDSLNHKPNTKITWYREGDPENGTLSFITGQSFTAGEQLYNNYGPKSNEELLLGYGFCLPNNEFDHISLKANITRDPQYEKKMEIIKRLKLESGNIDPLTYYIHKSHIPDVFFKVMRIFVMNSSDIYYYSDCQNSDQLEFISFRNELAMVSIFKQLLQSRLVNLKQTELNRENITSISQRFALIYRDGQETLYNNTLYMIEKLESNILSTMKLNIDNKLIAPQAPFNAIKNPNFFTAITENTTTSASLESVSINLEQLLNNDSQFNNVINELFDISEEEDIIFMLALIRETTKENSTLQPFLKNTMSDSAPYSDEQYRMNVEELYNDLFPACSDAYPDIFDTKTYSLDNLLWADNVLSNYTISHSQAIIPL